MWQADTIQNKSNDVGEQQGAVRQHSYQPTPRQVLSWLPKDATPEQQDSAIQRNIKPSEITWSHRPDTLHIPGYSKGRDYRHLRLPKYYKESFFSNSPYFHPEQPGGRLGVAGDPVPYTVAGDNLITSLLLGCFIIAVIAFSNSRRFIARQLKGFFYTPRERDIFIPETSTELVFQIFFALQTCLLFSLIFFFYSRQKIGDTFTIDYYQVIGIYTVIFAVYFLFKYILYLFSSRIFFDKKHSQLWMQTFLFLIAIEGVVFFPLVLLESYFELSQQTITVCVIIILSIFKLLSLYRSYMIFMHRKGSFLQIFLYFCALELVPLFIIWSVLVLTNSYLKINF